MGRSTADQRVPFWARSGPDLPQRKHLLEVIPERREKEWPLPGRLEVTNLRLHGKDADNRLGACINLIDAPTV
jgi:hypothetical protein